MRRRRKGGGARGSRRGEAAAAAIIIVIGDENDWAAIPNTLQDRCHSRSGPERLLFDDKISNWYAEFRGTEEKVSL